MLEISKSEEEEEIWFGEYNALYKERIESKLIYKIY